MRRRRLLQETRSLLYGSFYARLGDNRLALIPLSTIPFRRDSDFVTTALARCWRDRASMKRPKRCTGKRSKDMKRYWGQSTLTRSPASTTLAWCWRDRASIKRPKRCVLYLYFIEGFGGKRTNTSITLAGRRRTRSGHTLVMATEGWL